MPIPELTSGCIIGDLVVLYIFTPEVRREREGGEVKGGKVWGNSVREKTVLERLG